MRYGQREPRGGLPTTHEELAAAARGIGAALAGAPPEQSARDFLDGLDIAPGAREALLARVEISSANDASLVAARDLAGIAHVDDEPAPSITAGNQPLALAAALGPAVRLGAARWRASRGTRRASPASACGPAAPSSRPTCA